MTVGALGAGLVVPGRMPVAREGALVAIQAGIPPSSCVVTIPVRVVARRAIELGIPPDLVRSGELLQLIGVLVAPKADVGRDGPEVAGCPRGARAFHPSEPDRPGRPCPRHPVCESRPSISPDPCARRPGRRRSPVPFVLRELGLPVLSIRDRGSFRHLVMGGMTLSARDVLVGVRPRPPLCHVRRRLVLFVAGPGRPPNARLA